MKSTPHVSPALARLRGWVTFVGAVVAFCALTKLMVFGFVHFTDVRHMTVEAGPKPKAQLAVVQAGSATNAPAAKGRIENGRIIPEPAAGDGAGVAVDPNRVLSRGDTNMRHATAFASGAGLVCVILLAFLATLGTMVAAGGAVPGIEKTVASCVWSVVMLLFCVPWQDIAGAIEIPGVFASYGAMVSASERVTASESGEIALLAGYVLLPALALGCAVGIVMTFRGGVQAGVIVTAVSELDQAIDKELSLINERGVARHQPKAVGALFRAMGDEVSTPTTEGSMSGMNSGLRMRGEDRGRGMAEVDSGRPLPRPI